MPEQLDMVDAPLAGSVTRGATFSPDGTYRYTLRRCWGSGPLVAFVGLNPSTADARDDDPTIRRCIGFAKRWGFGALVMVNLFALRSTDPKALLQHDDPVGPANDEVLAAVLEQATMVVEAWGSFRLVEERSGDLRRRGVFAGNTVVLGRTKDGHPRHPLYMRADTHPVGGPFETPAVLPAAPASTAARLP